MKETELEFRLRHLEHQLLLIRSRQREMRTDFAQLHKDFSSFRTDLMRLFIFLLASNIIIMTMFGVLIFHYNN